MNGQSERRREVVVGQDRASEPRGHGRSIAQQQDMRDPRRQFLDMMGDEHGGRRVGIGCQSAQALDQIFSASEVHTGCRLVEQQ